MAATLDCEGTLSFHRTVRSQWGVVVRVEMTSARYVRRIQRLCSGLLLSYTKQKGNRKPHSIWQISSNGARWLLPQLLPHLIVKKRHAELLLEYLAVAYRGGHQFLKERGRFATVRDEMWDLNQRGKRGRETWTGDWRSHP